MHVWVMLIAAQVQYLQSMGFVEPYPSDFPAAWQAVGIACSGIVQQPALQSQEVPLRYGLSEQEFQNIQHLAQQKAGTAEKQSENQPAGSAPAELSPQEPTALIDELSMKDEEQGLQPLSKSAAKALITLAEQQRNKPVREYQSNCSKKSARIKRALPIQQPDKAKKK
jgi:hypothetical protein